VAHRTIRLVHDPNAGAITCHAPRRVRPVLGERRQRKRTIGHLACVLLELAGTAR
jgi:hypothetical protein